MRKQVTLALAGLGMALGGTGAQAQGAKSAPSLTDPQVAHVAVTANAIDVGMGKLALKRTKTKAVREFAETMIRDHTAVNEQAAALAKKLGVTPMGNDVSASLDRGAADARAKLEKLRGKAFDKAYIGREVAYHEAVLDALDKLLIPSAQNAELKGLLENVRPAVAAHLEHAKHLQSELGGK